MQHFLKSKPKVVSPWRRVNSDSDIPSPGTLISLASREKLDNLKKVFVAYVKKNLACCEGFLLLFFEGIASIIGWIDVNKYVFFGSHKPFA